MLFQWLYRLECYLPYSTMSLLWKFELWVSSLVQQSSSFLLARFQRKRSAYSAISSIPFFRIALKALEALEAFVLLEIRFGDGSAWSELVGSGISWGQYGYGSGADFAASAATAILCINSWNVGIRIWVLTLTRPSLAIYRSVRYIGRISRCTDIGWKQVQVWKYCPSFKRRSDLNWIKTKTPKGSLQLGRKAKGLGRTPLRERAGIGRVAPNSTVSFRSFPRPKLNIWGSVFASHIFRIALSVL